jgi:uncharacterized protein (DUF2147 family)
MSISGTWKNQLGSTLVLTVKGKNISGYYKTAVGDVNRSKRYPVVGIRDGEIISFIVLWKDHSSITSWVGRHITASDGERIYTMWLMADLYRDKKLKKKREIWNSFFTNSDVFTKQSGKS